MRVSDSKPRAAPSTTTGGTSAPPPERAGTTSARAAGAGSFAASACSTRRIASADGIAMRPTAAAKSAHAAGDACAIRLSSSSMAGCVKRRAELAVLIAAQ